MRSNERNPRHPWRSCRASAFENSLSGSVHPCTLPDASFCLAKTSLLRGTTAIHGGTDTCYRENHNCPTFILEPSLEIKQVLRADPTLLQIGDADARSVQKTPAGVLFARRGLFFVKRQRRCIAYFQKTRF